MMNAKQEAVFYMACSLGGILLSIIALAMQSESNSAMWVRLLISTPAIFGFALCATAIPRHWRKYRQN